MSERGREWSHVVAGLSQLTTNTTPEQMRIAMATGFELPENLPRMVSAALLRRHLRGTLFINDIRDRTPTENELSYLQDLANQQEIVITTDLTHVDVLDAWLQHIYHIRNLRCLRRLRPAAGDIVSVSRHGDTFLAEISSISMSGRLNFKGGAGAGAWPNSVEIAARTQESDYQSLHYQARQTAANWRRPSIPGTAVLAELEECKVSGDPSDAGIAAFVEALESAEDEKPLQRVLQMYPQLLAHLVTSTYGAYVIPQVQFGTQFVADFMLGGMSSLGLRWTFVELESPTAPLALKDGRHPKQLRKGLDQIRDWREYVQGNLDVAHKSKKDGGLGLYGIRPNDRGLLIIGRGSLTFDSDTRRRYVDEQEGIEIRTYDWLLREASQPRRLGFGVLDLQIQDADDEWDSF